MSGNDGRIKGWLRIPHSDGVARVADIVTRFNLGGVRTMDGELLKHDAMVAIGEKPKAVFMAGKPYLMVSPLPEADTVHWQTSSRRDLKHY
jgi:hypothetical protein